MNLAVLSVDNEVASSIDLSDVVKDFAAVSQEKFSFKFLTSVSYEN
jgi:hypothetical protein